MFKRYVIGAGVVVVLGAAIYGYGQYKFKAGKSAAQAEQYVADLEQFKRQVGELHSASVAIYQASTQLQMTLTNSIKDYQNEAIINPLPSDCVMSDGRVRSINNIISEAAAARQSGRTVPASGSTKK